VVLVALTVVLLVVTVRWIRDTVEENSRRPSSDIEYIRTGR
jgi:hypothetical protein